MSHVLFLSVVFVSSQIFWALLIFISLEDNITCMNDLLNNVI